MLSILKKYVLSLAIFGLFTSTIGAMDLRENNATKQKKELSQISFNADQRTALRALFISGIMHCFLERFIGGLGSTMAIGSAQWCTVEVLERMVSYFKARLGTASGPTALDQTSQPSREAAAAALIAFLFLLQSTCIPLTL